MTRREACKSNLPTKEVERSLLIRPSQIDGKLKAGSEPDGWHRIVYNASRVCVCSEPVQVAETDLAGFGDALRE